MTQYFYTMYLWYIFIFHVFLFQARHVAPSDIVLLYNVALVPGLTLEGDSGEEVAL